MRLTVSHAVWLGFISFHICVHGFPATSPRLSVNPNIQNDLSPTHKVPSCYLDSNTACMDLYIRKLEKRARRKKGSGNSNKPPTGPSTPDSPSPKPGPATPKPTPVSPKPTPDSPSPKPGPATPKPTPVSPEPTPVGKRPSPGRSTPSPKPGRVRQKKLKDAKKGEIQEYKLGKCGSELEGKILKEGPPRSRSPSPKPKPKSQPPTTTKSKRARGKKAKGKDKTESEGVGEKKLSVCTSVKLDFPVFPGAGTIIRGREDWEDKIKTFNVANSDPCSDNYDFGARKFPSSMTDALHTPEGIMNEDIWNSEHVMDGQIVKRFFDEMFRKELIPREELPDAWRQGSKEQRKTARPGEREEEKKKKKQTHCQYLDQFWRERWGDKPTAMTQLLEVYPGNLANVKEMVLFPGRLNRKKQLLFTVEDKKDVIGKVKWNTLSFHAKIDELREVVLLIQYMNEKKIQEAFKAVANRMTEKLAEIEGPPGLMAETDDYWYKSEKKSDPNAPTDLKDKPGEKYVSLKLSEKWSKWIYDFVTDRIEKMETLKNDYFEDLKKIHTEMLKYDDFTAAEKKEAKKRLEALEKNIRVKVTVSGLVDKPGGGSTTIPHRPKGKKPAGQ